MTRRVATAAAKPASDPEALVDELAIKIQPRILAGEYVGEEWLRQEALATEFGVSRTPVREALRKLEASGSLTLAPYRGTQARFAPPAQCGSALSVRSRTPGVLRRMEGSTQPVAAAFHGCRSGTVLVGRCGSLIGTGSAQDRNLKGFRDGPEPRY
jgi:hypothetical protein